VVERKETMITQTTARIANDPRRSVRAPYSGNATYRYARNEGGSATLVNLCPSGACLALGRYLRPGRFILVALETDCSPCRTIELKGQIVWCRPTEDAGAFLMGVRILQDDPDTGVAISDLLSRSQARETVGRHRPAPVWHLDGENSLKAAALSRVGPSRPHAPDAGCLSHQPARV